MENLRDAFDSFKVKIVPAKGLTINIDGIECYGLWGLVKKISLQDKIICKGIGKSIFVDKNHDLSYYVNDSDWADSYNCETRPGTFGYEWGGYGTETGITSVGVGTGLSNTNSLIEMNLQPRASGWHVVWDKIKEFRQNYSDNWFLPSKGELNLIYRARGNLNNLSLNTIPSYWSSSESTCGGVWYQDFSNGYRLRNCKNYHDVHSRLCRQY